MKYGDFSSKTPVESHTVHAEFVYISKCKLCHEETKLYQYFLTSAGGGSQTLYTKDNICDSCLEVIRKHFGIENRDVKS